ncbi:unnamed protein product [Ceutorhynchus assimilis]|uniref:Peptidoglycan recognition protein family domain-containing protein n=1 Tax=Ceutorhynchus assimilis TaxID=467358 RepID=A0A9N9MV03_9CUCU|nr:unnamed protein product [Ceutorhynchus assimilis]
MPLKSCSDLVLDDRSPSCSSQSSATESYSVPLGTSTEIDFKYDDEQVANILEKIPLPKPNGGNVTTVIGDNNTVGAKVNIGVDAETTTININHYHPKPDPDAEDYNEPKFNGQVRKVSEEKPRGFKDHLKERPTQFWIAGVFLAIISISSLILFFCLYNFSVPNPVPPTFGHDDNLGDGIQVIRREEWLARGPLNTTTFRKRPKIVRILHSTGPNCSDYQTCANKVLGLQSMHVGEDGLPDIAYNFLIGGDGNVYIGRGAEVQPEGRSDSIDIAYVGNYLAPYDRVSDKMDEAGRNLITRLLERKKILKDYIVVAQNQTEKTLSPGENVYKKIIQWPHYDSGIYYKN